MAVAIAESFDALDKTISKLTEELSELKAV